VAWSNAFTANGWTNWTGGLTLNPGTNVVQAYAVDIVGNKSTTNSTSFQFVVTNQLLVKATGLGTISPNYSNAWLEIGRNYTNKATGINGHVFTNWMISTNWMGGVTTNNATVQFKMAANLTLQANFADVTRPTNTITAPTSNQKLTNAMVVVKGTASDNAKVAAVFYQLNTNSWATAGTTNGFTNWTKTVTLSAGTNTVKAYAMDSTGNKSTTNSVSFKSPNTFQMRLFFSSARPLTNNGLGLSLNVSTGLACRIEVSTNLVNWTTMTNFFTTNTTMQFRDSAATNYDRRFYRGTAP
jgi:hypothetical protein